MVIAGNIIRSVLTAIYQYFWFTLIMTVLVMQIYLSAKEKGSLKIVLNEWWSSFKKKAEFRNLFFFTFYTVMIAYRTLLNRSMRSNPLSNVIGTWGLYDAEGKLTTECLENLVLFIPFVFLLHLCFEKKLCKSFDFKSCMTLSFKFSLIVSAAIEILQLFLRLGTVQLSDLFFNTLGGVAGGLIYWIVYRIKKQRVKNENIDGK